MQHNKSPEWSFPQTLDQALQDISGSHAVVVAGGTTLLDLLKLGHGSSERLIDITRLPLKWVEKRDGVISIGSMVSNSATAEAAVIKDHFPVLSQAILQGASQQIRNAATVGGNLLQATRCVYFRSTEWRCNRRDPNTGCEAVDAPTHAHAALGGSKMCIAVNPSDMAVALLALDAAIITTSLEGADIRMPIAELYPLPGDTPHITSNIPPGSLITSIEIPITTAARNSSYLKLRARASYEFATVSVAATLELDAGVVTAISVALGGIGTRPWRRKDLEHSVIGKVLTQSVIDEFCDGLLAEEHSVAETRHKVELARNAVKRVLLERAEAAYDRH
ncbi:FAD binding domain-containing protein [Agrobacterium salinitolerans]|uniref:FAD binding domain-containing protein n=1 Tax=Agrobacterium salinitolerans TaxID=1183413 RepID=UPI0035B3FCB5